MVSSFFGLPRRTLEFDGVTMDFDASRHPRVWSPSIDTFLMCKALAPVLDAAAPGASVLEVGGAEGDAAEIELTHNWDQTDPYPSGRFFGHLAFEVDDIYASCSRLRDAGVTIHRPPRDGRMAFVKSPDGHSVELLQRGHALPSAEPWASMPNTGTW